MDSKKEIINDGTKIELRKWLVSCLIGSGRPAKEIISEANQYLNFVLTGEAGDESAQ
jgi:hypothetical protein